MAVFNTSKDPIFLKKISLRIWRLRDEIETIILERLKKGEEKIEDLAKEYSLLKEKSQTEEANIPLISIPSEKTTYGKAIISEINMKGIRFFSANNYVIGNSLVVEFQIRRPFRLNAVVLETKNYDLKSKLISEKKLPFRIELKWTFLKTGERTLMREFLQSLTGNKKIEETPAEEKKSA